jgi:hypothetical protein
MKSELDNLDQKRNALCKKQEILEKDVPMKPMVGVICIHCSEPKIK